MVCGSIGYGGIEEIRRMYSLLREKGFDTIDHIDIKGMDYSNVKDFRRKKRLSHQIVNRDFEYVKKADVIVVLHNAPSYGTGIEMSVAKSAGKKIVLVAKNSVPSPWPINFSDYIVTTEEELIRVLRKLEKKR